MLNSLASSTTGDKNIFGKTHSRKFTFTYHNLDHKVDLGSELLSFKHQIVMNIFNSRKEYVIKEIYMAKEPYSDPDKLELVHIHALIIFEKKIRIHSVRKFAELLSITYGEKIYYPHVSILVNIHAYKNYITKLRCLDSKYLTAEWYNYWLDNSIELGIQHRLEEVAKKPKLVREDIMQIIHSYNLDLVMKYRSKIDFLYAKCPVKHEIDLINNVKLTIECLKYTEKDYKEYPKYEKIKQKIYEYLSQEDNKCSLRIVGAANEYKTSMVQAACVQYQEDYKNQKVLIVSAIDIEHLKCLNRIDQSEYDKIIVIIDDYDIKENVHSKDEILNILSGNYTNSSMPSRYENVYFSKCTYKIFIHNAKFRDVIQSLKEGMSARVDELEI